MNRIIKFYILVPVYKAEKYIQQCITSVLDQTYSDFEMILVDDGSPDCSGTICDEYASKDSRITVIHQKNMGVIAARQSAIKYIFNKKDMNVNDSFIVFLDSDDSLKINALRKIYQSILEYNCDMIVYGWDLVEEGKIRTPYHPETGENMIVSDKRLLYKKVFGDFEYNSLCRKSISLCLVSEIDYSKFYDISHGEDLLQSIAYYKNAKKILFLDESLYNYTINPESITHTVTEKKFKINFTVRQKVMEFLLLEDVFTEDDWIQYRGYCVSLLINSLKNIILFTVPYDKKISWFKEIWYSEYYNKYIKRKKYDTTHLVLWKKCLYRLYSNKTTWPLLILGGKFFKLISVRYRNNKYGKI